MRYRHLPLSQLTIDDDEAFESVGVYRDLKAVLLASPHQFAVPPAGERPSWHRVTFLNLTFWGRDIDVLTDKRVPADVVAHVAWHRLADAALKKAGARPGSADALFLAESVASAFDMYLVGRLLETAPESDFVESQVPRMAEIAEEEGRDEDEFQALLESVSAEPEKAFEELRQLLFDVTTGLVGATDIDAAANVLGPLQTHRFHDLLHHYELSNWILAARSEGVGQADWLAPDPVVRKIDQELRGAKDALELLHQQWVLPALGKK